MDRGGFLERRLARRLARVSLDSVDELFLRNFLRLQAQRKSALELEALAFERGGFLGGDADGAFQRRLNVGAQRGVGGAFHLLLALFLKALLFELRLSLRGGGGAVLLELRDRHRHSLLDGARVEAVVRGGYAFLFKLGHGGVSASLAFGLSHRRALVLL